MFDSVGAGSKDFGLDGRLENGGWARGAKGLRKGGQQSIQESFEGAGAAIKSAGLTANDCGETAKSKLSEGEEGEQEGESNTHRANDRVSDSENTVPPEKQIFRNLVIYINGSTYPLISDHKLKRLLAAHGARLSIALGRRTVTHVILGTPIKNGVGAGGGLASSKIQKEIATVKGAGVKYVGVEWVLESIKAQRRLPEARFANLKLASKGQNSVLGKFKPVTGE